MIAASQGRAVITASAICSAVSTSTRITPVGVFSATGAAPRVTLAPASAAAAAMAKPCRPDERQHRGHLMAGFLQQPHQFAALVGRDSPPMISKTRFMPRNCLAARAKSNPQ
jgi:hypothetical protein